MQGDGGIRTIDEQTVVCQFFLTGNGGCGVLRIADGARIIECAAINLDGLSRDGASIIAEGTLGSDELNGAFTHNLTTRHHIDEAVGFFVGRGCAQGEHARNNQCTAFANDNHITIGHLLIETQFPCVGDINRLVRLKT